MRLASEHFRKISEKLLVLALRLWLSVTSHTGEGEAFSRLYFVPGLGRLFVLKEVFWKRVNVNSDTVAMLIAKFDSSHFKMWGAYDVLVLCPNPP